MPIRVAFRLTQPSRWTGGVNYILNICRVLRRHAPDVQPVLFAPPDVSAAIRAQIVEATGSEPIELADRSRRDDYAALLGLGERKSAAAFEAENIDLIFEATGFYGLNPKRPTLAWLPDFQHRRLPQLFTRTQWWIRELRYRLLLANRKHILLSSNDSAADLRAYFGDVKGEVHVVPFAVQIEVPPSQAQIADARARYEITERYIFLPNQFWAHKNHGLVVEALGVLGDAAPLIVSSGLAKDHRNPGYVEGLKDRLNVLGVADRFRFLGMIPYRDILALNAGADALINPSLCEGWSTTVEEAKALSTPLLLSNLAVHQEQAGDLARYFPPDDAEACASAIRSVSEEAPRVYIACTNEAAEKHFANQLVETFRMALAG